MWRPKSDVQQEINVPPQSDITYRLKFSTERHFMSYRKECKSVANADQMKDVSKQIDGDIERAPHFGEQACCHHW